MNLDLIVFIQEINYQKKNGAYVINLDEYTDTGTYWIALHSKNNKVIYFDSFGVEYIPKEVKNFIKNKYIKTNIFRVQAYGSIMFWLLLYFIY